MDIREYLKIDEFRVERPNMSIMNDSQIQEAINIACDLLDSKCNGLISEVLNYSETPEADKDVNHPLYRTAFELAQIKKAFIFQAQFNLNLGNDFTQGSSSFSTGGVSGSFQRPENRETIAPGVYEFLAKARVFVFMNAIATKNIATCDRTPLENKYLTRELANQTFVTKYQPNSQKGMVAVIGDSSQVTFQSPSDLQFQVVKAQKILDNDGEYKSINQVNNLAFFGPNGYNAMTREQVYKGYWQSQNWAPTITYPAGMIINAYDELKNEVATFRSLQDNNLGHNPWDEYGSKTPIWWKNVGNIDKVDFDKIAEIVLNDPTLQQKFTDINTQQEQQNTLIENNANAIKETKIDLNNAFNQIVELNASQEAQDTSIAAIQANYVTTNTDQEIDSKKSFKKQTTFYNLSNSEVAMKIQMKWPNDAYVESPIAWFDDTTKRAQIYVNKENNAFNFEGFKNINMFARDGSFAVGANGNIVLNVDNTNTQHLITNTTPTQPNSLTTKAYVDSAIANVPGGQQVDWANVQAPDGLKFTINNVLPNGDMVQFYYQNELFAKFKIIEFNGAGVASFQAPIVSGGTVMADNLKGISGTAITLDGRLNMTGTMYSGGLESTGEARLGRVMEASLTSGVTLPDSQVVNGVNLTNKNYVDGITMTIIKPTTIPQATSRSDLIYREMHFRAIDFPAEIIDRIKQGKLFPEYLVREDNGLWCKIVYVWFDGNQLRTVIICKSNEFAVNQNIKIVFRKADNNYGVL